MDSKDRKLDIVYAAAEMVPFAKVGGLADVAGSLTQVLARQGHRVSVFLPLYPGARKQANLRLEPVASVGVRLGDRVIEGKVHHARLAESGVEVYFLENDAFYDRPNPYVDPKTGQDWPDNAERFAFFSRAILETCAVRGWAPDVFHLNDYQVGLVAALLREEHAGNGLGQSATVYSIHNLGYQGIFPRNGTDPSEARELAERLSLNPDLMYPMAPLEFYGRLNFTKAALTYADLIVAVSPTYAREIQTEEFGFGLDGVLRARTNRVIGILNGIDADLWNPATDALLPHNYGPSDFPGKAENKARLLEAMHLPQDLGTPLIGIISRLVDQKGFDLLAEVAGELFRAGKLRMVILGSGMPKYEELFRKLAKQYPDRLAVEIGFNDPLAHLIEAGADFFLMPSKYEPCGLNQMYSMRYGTVPIVRATGGLADTVTAFDPTRGRGTGFVFEDYTPEALRAAIERALAAYGQQRSFKNLITRIMALDFSWERAAREYVRAYERAMRCRRGEEVEVGQG